MASNPTASMSYYPSAKSKNKTDISIENYIGFIQYGSEQDTVLKGRIIKQTKTHKEYQEFKVGNCKCVTGSAIMNEGSKEAGNIKSLNGYIVIDIDENVTSDLTKELKSDKYTSILHQSFGGDGLCIFVKINKDKFADSFTGLAQYYYDSYGVVIDSSCSNPNRLRYISYDPDIFVNEKSAKFTPVAKEVKKYAEPKDTNFIYTKSDFDNILEQIRDRSINLVNGDYSRYIRIGFALYDKFGNAGEEYFRFINSFNPNLNKKKEKKEWLALCKPGACKIGTFYFYCKEAGINIYSEKTKMIINRVKVAKIQGNPTVESIEKNLEVANGLQCNDDDRVLIRELIASNIDYSKEANDNFSDTEQIENFICDTYQPTVDVISNKKRIYNGTEITDDIFNDIYLTTKKNFDFNVPLADIRAILNSNSVKKINSLTDFIRENKSTPTGLIDEYVGCIHPVTDYNKWAFKRWIVGAIHNWTAATNEKIICPLTLVLTGQQHGTGKTSFFRNILPEELSDYFIQEKINSKDKDSMFRLCSALIIYDDEFGGEGFRDVKAFKAVSDINMVTQRRPYGQVDVTLKRRAALCGTSNERDILKDVTGNRRILPITVERIDYDRMININKSALIMEAYNLLKSGFEWIIRTEEDINYLKDNCQHNETVMPIEEIFFKHFSLNQTETHTNERIMNQGEILEYLNGSSNLSPTKYDLKEVLTKNKLEYKKHRISTEKTKDGLRLFLRRNVNSDSDNDSEVPF